MVNRCDRMMFKVLSYVNFKDLEKFGFKKSEYEHSYFWYYFPVGDDRIVVCKGNEEFYKANACNQYFEDGEIYIDTIDDDIDQDLADVYATLMIRLYDAGLISMSARG